MSFVGLGGSREPKFELQTTQGLPTNAGHSACYVNAARTNLETAQGSYIGLLAAYNAGVANGSVRPGDAAMNSFSGFAEANGAGDLQWQGVSTNSAGKTWNYFSVADDPEKYRQMINQQLAAGHAPVIVVSGHAMNITGTENVNGHTYYTVMDQGFGPSLQWTHVDPDSNATKSDGNGSHGSEDRGWQMLHRDPTTGEMKEEKVYKRSNVMWGMGYYAPK